MKRAIGWVVGLAALGAAAVSAWVVLTPAPQPSVVIVTLDSVPSGASVFSGNEYFAATPVIIRLAPDEARTFRLVKRDFADRFVSVRADDFLPSAFRLRLRRHDSVSQTLRVALTPLLASALRVTSDPSGAVVYADGRRLGVTPLLAGEIQPGRHTLCLDHPECYRDTFEAVLNPGEKRVAHRELRAKVPVLYRDMLAKEPGSLFRYTELIQYYVSAGDYENAVKYLRDGYETLKRPDASEHDEYFTMLKKIYARWFEYPEEGEMANIRPLCRELIVKARKERLWDVSAIQKHMDEMDKYDMLHRGSRWIRR